MTDGGIGISIFEAERVARPRNLALVHRQIQSG